MKITILTLFPEMFAPLNHSIVKRAQSAGKLEVNIVNFRDFSTDKHKKVDDAPFGGGKGMLLTCQPIADCLEAIDKQHKAWRVYLSPKGQVFTQNKAKTLAKHKHLILLCGHYEGVDQRIIDNYIDEEISIGEYVLTGGELPAMVVADSVARMVPGVLSAGSGEDESFFTGRTLEYPQYTRPQNFRGYEVPQTLVGGNHQQIENWKKENKKKL